MDGAIVTRISRDQFLQWIDDYYHGHAGANDMRDSFVKRFDIGHLDQDLLGTTLEKEQDILDIIETRYVQQL